MSVKEDVSQIIDSIQSCMPHFPVSYHDIEHPTSEFAINFFRHFKECIEEFNASILGDADYLKPEPEPKSNDSIYQLLAYTNTYLKGPCAQIDVEYVFALTLTDLYAPTAKRMRVAMKMLLNSLMSCRVRMDAIRDIVVGQLQVNKQLEEKIERVRSVREDVAKEAEKLARLEDAIKKLEREAETANEWYETLQKQKHNNERRYQEQKHKLQGLVGAYQNKEALLSNLQTEIQLLNEQIVSEDNFKSLMDLKKNLVSKNDELDIEIDCAAKNLKDRSPALEHFDMVNKQVCELKVNCEELKQAQDKLYVAQSELCSAQEAYEGDLEKLKKLNETKLKCKDSCKGVQDAHQGALAKHNKLYEQIKQKMEQIVEQQRKEEALSSSISSEKAMLQKNIQHLEKVCVEKSLEIGKLNEFYGNMYKSMLSSENDIVNSTKQFLEDLNKCFI